MKKSTKVLIIVGSIIAALGITFVIMLFSGQKETKLNVTGDPVKDVKVITDLLTTNPSGVKNYLDLVGREYTDPAKTASFRTELENATKSINLKVFGEPDMDAQVFVNIAFLEVNNMEVCQAKAMEFLEMVQADQVYQNDSLRMASFKSSLDTLLNNEGMSLSDLGL